MHRREIIFSLLLAAVFLLAAGFFFFTSSFFLTHLLVPWIARSSGCPMAAERAEFRPFSQRLILYNFRLGRAEKPFLTVSRARGTAQFGKLVRGIIDFDDVELTGAELNICRDASGRWCSYELGLTEEENESASGSSDSRPVQVRLARSRVEDSRINVIVHDRQRDFSWSFTGISGEVDDFRNGGAAVIKCVSPFQVKGRDGFGFAGKVEWNGELLLDEELCFAGMRGGFVFDSLTGNIDKHSIGGSVVRCALDLGLDKEGKWFFRNFRLIQQKRQQVGSLVEFSGSLPDDSGKYRLDFRRFMLSGQLLTVLMDMGVGIRPGSMRVDGFGSVTGDPGCFSADLVCHAGRKAGPAYFGAEKVDLPDFQLKTEQNITFDIRSGKVDFRKARVQISSGGRQILDVRKNPAEGSVKARIDRFELKLLQLLIPDAQRFKISGGQVSGDIFLKPGSAADSVFCHTDLHFSGIGFRSGVFDTGLFDAVLTGTFAVPRSGNAVKVESLQLDAGRNGQNFVKASASGTISRRGTEGNLNWKVSGDPVPLLTMLQTPATADVINISGLFSPVRFDSSGKLKFTPGGISVQDSCMRLHGREQSSAALQLENDVWQWSAAKTAGWKIHWKAAFPAILIPAMPWASLAGGRCSGEGIVNVPGRVAGFSVSGDVEWHELSGILCGKSFRQLGGGMEFSLVQNSKGVYNLNRSAVYCRMGSKPALRLEGSGSGDPAAGSFHSEIQVRYLNEHFLNILLPGRFRTCQLSGRSVIRGDSRNQKWALDGYFAVDRLQTYGASRPVDGKLQYAFTRDGAACKIPSGKLTLNSGGKVLADLRMTMDVPADAASPVKIRFSGSPVDLSSLYAQIGSSGTGPGGELPKNGRLVLDTGARAAEVHLDLRNMSWGNGQDFALRGDLVFLRNRITAENMVVDGGQGQFVWGLDGLDYPEGMVLTANAKVTKPFAIGPFASLFFPESGLDGIVESGECCLNFRRLFTAHWGEDLVGSCKLKFKKVEFPVNAANGPLSRLLLLPVETIVRAEQLIPATWDVREHFKTLWQYKFSAESPFARLKFYSGDLLVAAANGELQVKRMMFTGEPLSQMQVAGKMRLVEPYELEFDSNVLLCGVQAKLPVRGGLQSPRVAAWQVFANLPGSALAGWLDIFTPFQDERKTMGIPFISPFMRLLRDFAGFRE